MTGISFARDPSIAARTLVSEFENSGFKIRERDARVAFISDGDFSKGPRSPNHEESGRNADNLEQLFIWREKDERFQQATRNTDFSATMARPSISEYGRSVAFESTADLVPDAVNAREPSQVGNPDNVYRLEWLLYS